MGHLPPHCASLWQRGECKHGVQESAIYNTIFRVAGCSFISFLYFIHSYSWYLTFFLSLVRFNRQRWRCFTTSSGLKMAAQNLSLYWNWCMKLRNWNRTKSYFMLPLWWHASKTKSYRLCTYTLGFLLVSTCNTLYTCAFHIWLYSTTLRTFLNCFLPTHFLHSSAMVSVALVHS